ncbi:MAG TPA: DNA-3-methyladenine glycosylase, partial [Polyangiaceae bacterium]|nr:DNA-3-methyladenine glycosylase [Polyangiaceae bacterium]
EIMAARRNMAAARRELTNGPGKLCAALGLGRDHYGADLCGETLFLAPGDCGRVGRSPRINIDYAGRWAKKPWRFYERGNRYVSVKPRD